MKNIKILVVISLRIEASFSIAQTSAEKDKELNEKYWIYRDRLRKRFVNIGGKEDGQSIPFIQFKI